jgi:hypothetical protein
MRRAKPRALQHELSRAGWHCRGLAIVTADLMFRPVVRTMPIREDRLACDSGYSRMSMKSPAWTIDEPDGPPVGDGRW